MRDNRAPKHRARALPATITYVRKHQSLRQSLLREPWRRPMVAMVLAAVLIQRVFRGHLQRTRNARRRGNNQAIIRHRRLTKQLDKYLAALGEYSRSGLPKPARLEIGYSGWCAVRIQAWWRMILVQQRYWYFKFFFYELAACEIQRAWSEHRRALASRFSEKRLKRLVSTRDQAAQMIQNAWRSFCNVRIYKYYRDLIHFKAMGDPAQLLRTVIPCEANLFDRAAGVHIRFRLGGSTFPPLLLFKVYTHRPCCDVNAFAPRDYTAERTVIRSAGSISMQNETKTCAGRIRVGAKYFGTMTTTNCDDLTTWYHREEFNGWRPIVHQSVVSAVDAAVLAETNRQAFHYSTIQRRKDVERRKRQRRREWLVKLYLQHHPQSQRAPSSEEDDQHRPPSSPAAIIPRRDMLEYGAAPRRDDSNDDVELLRELRNQMLRTGCGEPTLDHVQSLLDWSSSLDYAEYSSGWQKLATSASSDREPLAITSMPSVVSLTSDWSM